MFRYTGTFVVLLAMLVGVNLFEGLTSSAAASNGGMIPLYGWYSPSRGDNFATTHPSWRGAAGETRSPDYDFVRIEGLTFDPNLPQPEGTIPLYSWYSPSRGDNFATTHPSWRGGAGETRSPDYDFVRIEGYVFDPDLPQPEGTIPLYGWYSLSRGDNFATTHPSWRGAAGETRSPDYDFVRVEGFVSAIVPPSDE